MGSNRSFADLADRRLQPLLGDLHLFRPSRRRGRVTGLADPCRDGDGGRSPDGLVFVEPLLGGRSGRRRQVCDRSEGSETFDQGDVGVGRVGPRLPGRGGLYRPADRVVLDECPWCRRDGGPGVASRPVDLRRPVRSPVWRRRRAARSRRRSGRARRRRARRRCRTPGRWSSRPRGDGRGRLGEGRPVAGLGRVGGDGVGGGLQCGLEIGGRLLEAVGVWEFQSGQRLQRRRDDRPGRLPRRRSGCRGRRGPAVAWPASSSAVRARWSSTLSSCSFSALVAPASSLAGFSRPRRVFRRTSVAAIPSSSPRKADIASCMSAGPPSSIEPELVVGEERAVVVEGSLPVEDIEAAGETAGEADLVSDSSSSASGPHHRRASVGSASSLEMEPSVYDCALALVEVPPALAPDRRAIGPPEVRAGEEHLEPLGERRLARTVAPDHEGESRARLELEFGVRADAAESLGPDAGQEHLALTSAGLGFLGRRQGLAAEHRLDRLGSLNAASINGPSSSCSSPLASLSRR